MKKNRKCVIKIYPAGDPLWLAMLRGIADYADHQPDWTLQFYPEGFASPLDQLKDRRGDGILALLRTQAEVAAAGSSGLPVVNLAAQLKNAGGPRVMVDHEAVGRLAAEHLIGCGLSHFAYYGERNIWYSELRKQGFVNRLAADGHLCSVLENAIGSRRNNPWHIKHQPLLPWLRKLPKPVGLFAVHDHAATAIIHICSQIGLRVPDDVAVLGAGNDLTMCKYFEISSVARNRRKVGYQAAKLLDALMSGKKPPKHDILIPPEGVVQRRSTEIVATNDPRLSAAVHFIREHVGQPFTVKDMCRKLDTSRRTLEVSFRDGLGASPRDYIANARIQRAKQLLIDSPDLKLEQVSRRCGFYTPQAFYTTFRRNVGSTPTEYRRRMREEGLERKDP